MIPQQAAARVALSRKSHPITTMHDYDPEQAITEPIDAACPMT